MKEKATTETIKTPELDALEQRVEAGRKERDTIAETITERIREQLNAAGEAQARSDAASANGDVDEAITAGILADECERKAEMLRSYLDAQLKKPLIPEKDYRPTLAPVLKEAQAINAAHLAEVAQLHRTASALYDKYTAFRSRLEDALNDFDKVVDGYQHREKSADGRLLQQRRPATLDGVAREAARAAASATAYAAEQFEKISGQ